MRWPLDDRYCQGGSRCLSASERWVRHAAAAAGKLSDRNNRRTPSVTLAGNQGKASAPGSGEATPGVPWALQFPFAGRRQEGSSPDQ